MSTLNEIGRCHTDYGYVVIGSYGDPDYNEKVAYFYRTDGESYKFSLFEIGEIMEKALDYWSYDYWEGYEPKSLENWDTLQALLTMQAKLFMNKYDRGETEDD